ncbi:hypothetical protein AB0D87_38250 [Streptomyces sp. NPDC048342]|uniref:hypothetical protein n=1 Tax=unclassified Streptomyces TaxID=2593676 RepID=UPI003436A665
MGRQRTSKAVDLKKFETAVDMARALPHHFRPVSDSPVLTQEERENLAQCEAAVDTLQWAFYAAGKALQIIRDGRLYRAGYATFEAYTLARWNMKENYANKLIRTWRIAEALFELSSNGSVPIGTVRRLNQAQAWELVPVAEQYSLEAAQHVYRTTVEVDGEEVTASVIKGAVQALPKAPEFDPETAGKAIRSALQESTPRKPRVTAKPKVVATQTGESKETSAADGAAGLEGLLPWNSPEALNGVLRQYMTDEDRRTLGKMLTED